MAAFSRVVLLTSWRFRGGDAVNPSGDPREIASCRRGWSVSLRRARASGCERDHGCSGRASEYSHLRRESARHCEARKADDGSRTRDHRLGNQRLDPPPQRGRHPPTRRRSIPSPFALTAGTTTRGTLTAGHSVVTVSPSPRVRCHRPVAATPLEHTRRCLLDWGPRLSGLPEPERLTAAAAGCWTGCSSAPARTRTWDLRS